MKIGNIDHKQLTTIEEFVKFHKEYSPIWDSNKLIKTRVINHETYQPMIAVYNEETHEAFTYTLELAQDAKSYCL